MPAWLTWLLGVVLVTGESAGLTTVGFGAFTLQMGLVFTIVLALRRDFVSGAWTLVALIPVVDWFAGGPGGLYALGCCVVFAVLQSIRAWLPRDWGVMHFGAAAGAAILHGAVVAAAAFVLQIQGHLPSAVVWSLPTSIVGVTVGVLPVQWLVARGDEMFEQTRTRELFG